MKIQRSPFKAIGLLLCLLLCSFSVLLKAAAAEPSAAAEQSSLAIDVPCPNAVFRLYQIALGSDAGHYTLAEPFSAYPVSFDLSDSSSWRVLASTLGAYAARDKIAPTRREAADENGKILFSALDAGVYLAVGDSCVSDASFYTFTPFLVSLPARNAQGQTIAVLSASPKYECTPASSPVSVTAVKTWSDGSSEQRPASVEVQLLRDDEIWDTVVLNEANQWRHTWSELESGCLWQVTEKTVPAGYTVSIERRDGTILLCNTLPGTDSPAPPPLPQTGALWWPVAAFIVSGLLFLLIGCLLKKKNHAN